MSSVRPWWLKPCAGSWPMYSKLGPREKGRKSKGRPKPVALKQAKARAKALKKKLMP